ncbi:plasmid recombination protein [Pannonibacter sp. Q-1]
MGFQFIHLEAYARKKDAQGRDIGWVLAEARRDPEASLHVESPARPELVRGIGLDELAALHEELADAATTTLKNGQTRKVRKDQKSLLTVVASYPTPLKELDGNPAEHESLKSWEQRTVEWLHSQFGDDLMTVIRHTDERYPHLHAFVLPRSDQELRALRMHPGHEAKRRVMDSHPTSDSKKDLNRIGDRAFRDAMRGWQDSYHKAVGVPSGLTRLGPARRRLSREAWHAEQVAAQAVKAAEERAARYVEVVKSKGSAYAERIKAEATNIRNDAELRAAEAKAAQARATRLERQAQGVLERARREAARILEGVAPYRKFGAFLRSIWDGVNSSKIRRQTRSEFAQQIENLSREASEERASRRRAEQRASELESAMRNSGLVEAATSREVSRLKRRLDAEIDKNSNVLTPESALTAPSGGGNGY